MKQYSYHQWSKKDLEKHFDVDSSTGLTKEKANFRLLKYGENSLSNLKSKSVTSIFFAQFSNLFIVLLLIAAVISYFVDGIVQAIILLAIVLFNIFMGFFQEFKAEKALADLKQSYQSNSRVLRNGEVLILDNNQIVVGDIVLFESGNKIPADLRIIEEESLRINESSLTGESVPISKNISVLPEETLMADRRNIAYAGTMVVNGHGRGIVIATGENTEFGMVAQLIEKDEEKTPLEKQVNYLGKIITIAAFGVAALIFALGYFRNYELLPLFTFTIALLVAAVPESLPTAITLSLAIGVSRMAKNKAIVRRMSVVEALGTTNIIATDKTGTLTDNKLRLGIALTYDKSLKEYDLLKKQKDLNLYKLLGHGLICSNIDYKEQGEHLGDPLETAIADAADGLSSEIIAKAKTAKRIMEIPFNSDNKYMAVLSDAENKQLIVKGSVERILHFSELKPAEKMEVEKEASRLSKMGYKVIALADKHVNNVSTTMLKAMRFRGLLAFIDEPSAGIKEAIKKTIDAGIRPIIITGDHQETARFIANQVGMNVKDDEIMTKLDLDQLTNKELKKYLEKVKVFARITPEDKINIVKILQEMGYSVAVTGDGVNDAPALKEAQVGIAMGIKGTDVAKDSADIILSDDRYGTIISAVAYGRSIYDNIKNVIVHLFSGNFNELLLVGLAFLFGLPIPLLTLQILWVNMVTDNLPALALSFERPSVHVLKEKPRSISVKSLKGSLKYALYLSILSFTLCLLVYLWGLNSSIDKARTLLFTFFVYFELIKCFSIRSKKRFWQDIKSFFDNKFLIYSLILSALLQLALFFEPIRKIFSLTTLNRVEVLVLVSILAFSFFGVELIRLYIDKTEQRTK